MNHRFTRDGSAALESHLFQVCEHVRASVKELIPARSLEALLLGGGYGRGEGGVLRTPDGDQPYNDLEFYVMITGNVLLAERRWSAQLHRIAEKLSGWAGAEIEFKLASLRRLRAAQPTMFSYDLVQGHYWVVGDDHLFAHCQRHRDATRIPHHEATRLLMNRCSGLLFCRQQLQRPSFGQEQADFVGRNLAKAQLGLGDAVLAMQARYHWSCLERQRRLAELQLDPKPAWLDELRRHHAAGVEFKLHPLRSREDRSALVVRHAEVCELARSIWLWLESMRLSRSFSGMRDYAKSPEAKCPESFPPKNWLINVRTFGLGGGLGPYALRYPRERLLRALVLLLFVWPGEHDAAVLRELQRLLHSEASDFEGLVKAYQALWSRFN